MNNITKLQEEYAKKREQLGLVLMGCNECGHEDEYDKDYANKETFPDGIECPFCRDGVLKVYENES